MSAEPLPPDAWAGHFARARDWQAEHGPETGTASPVEFLSAYEPCEACGLLVIGVRDVAADERWVAEVVSVAEDEWDPVTDSAMGHIELQRHRCGVAVPASAQVAELTFDQCPTPLPAVPDEAAVEAWLRRVRADLWDSAAQVVGS